MHTLRPPLAVFAIVLCASIVGCSGCAAPATGAEAAPPVLMLELGEVKVQAMAVRAARPDTPLEPGKPVEVALWVGFHAADPNPQALRAWIGTEPDADAAKALAELAPPTKRHHFRAAVTVPAALAADARLHVEIEDSTGKAEIVSFDLRR